MCRIHGPGICPWANGLISTKIPLAGTSIVAELEDRNADQGFVAALPTNRRLPSVGLRLAMMMPLILVNDTVPVGPVSAVRS